jgi:tetratricopeptide (TPR) repeat protein
MSGWRLLAVLLWLCPAAHGQDDAPAAKSTAAKQALQSGRYAEAIKLYRELTRVLPDNAGLHFNLGLALDKNGQPAEAVPELERATKSEPKFGPAWFLLGLAYQQLGQPQKAIDPLRRAVRLEPANTQALFELADAELATGDPAAAAESFRTLAARQPGMAKAWQGLGLAYVALAERVFALAGERAPQSGYWCALAARARAGEGRYANALSLYSEALKQLPSLTGLHAERAAIYRQTSHPDWAEMEEQREASLPKLDCTSRPAGCAYLAGDWERVLTEARKAATPENFYWSSLAYGKLAEQSFAKLAQLPPSAEIHELQAESFQRMGRRAEAVAEWRKALAMAPADRRLQGRLAESLARNRDYEEAARLLEPLAAQQLENGEWQYLLGDALLEQHRESDAAPHLVAAVRLKPDFLPAHEALGRACLALGRYGEAVTNLEQALAIDDGAVSFALSSAYRRLGRTEDANRALARYRELTHESGTAAGAAGEDAIPPP